MMNHSTFNSELTRAEQTLQQPLETSNIDITEQPIGTAGDDYLYAQSGNNILSGRAGNDYIYNYIEEVRDNIFLGEAGSDTLYGGGGNDALFGGEGNDYLAGSQYNPNEDTYDESLNSHDNWLDLIFDNTETSVDSQVQSIDTLYDTSLSYELFEPNIDFGSESYDPTFFDPVWSSFSYTPSIFDEVDTLTGGAGADTFSLGDGDGHYYQDISYSYYQEWCDYCHAEPYLVRGQTNDYAIITDFSSQEGDVFQVYGNIEHYSLDTTTNWTGEEAADTLIKFGEDTIAIVTDNTDVSLERDFFTADNALDNVEQTFIDEVILG